MRDKILLNGQIAELKGLVDGLENDKMVYQNQIINDEEKLTKLFRVMNNPQK